MRPDDDDSDSATAELLQRAYGRRVDVDTAARHLWAIDSAARSARGRRRVGRRRRAVVSVLTSVMLVASSGAAVGASTGTLPGDTLYVVKRGTERVRLALAVRPEADAQTRLAIAHERWSEAQRAAEARPETVPALLQEVLDALKKVEHHGGAVAERALVLRTQVTADSGKIALGAPRAKGSAAAGSQDPRDGRAMAAKGSEDELASAARSKPAGERREGSTDEAATDPAAPTVAIPPRNPASSPPKASSPVPPEPSGPSGEAETVPAPTAAAPATAVPAAGDAGHPPGDGQPDAGDPAGPPDAVTDPPAPDPPEVTDSGVDEAADGGGAPAVQQSPSPRPRSPYRGRFAPADGL